MRGHLGARFVVEHVGRGTRRHLSMAKLYFYYSAMNAGKSTTLLQSAYNYRERGMNVMLFTPKLDNRYEVGKITSATTGR